MIVPLQEPACAASSRTIGTNKLSTPKGHLLTPSSTFKKEECGSPPDRNTTVSGTAILGVGDFFGELCLVGFPHHVSTAVALTASSIQVIKKESMIRMLHQKNKVSNSFVSYLLSSIRKYQNHVAELLTSSAEQRLACVLLRLANLDRRDPPIAGFPILSDQVLAEMIGTTRPRVNLFMNRFRKRGLISHIGRIEVHKFLQEVLRRGRDSAPPTDPWRKSPMGY